MDSILFRLNHAEKYLLAGIIEIHDVVEVTCQPYDDGFEVQVFTAGKGSINLLHKIKLTGIPRQVEFIKARGYK